MTASAHDARYPGTAVAAAALASLFFPVISLIAALVLLSREHTEARRRQLRLWAWATAGWMALQALVFLLFVAAFSASSAGS